jgi:hypothetical protein
MDINHGKLVLALERCMEGFHAIAQVCTAAADKIDRGEVTPNQTAQLLRIMAKEYGQIADGDAR